MAAGALDPRATLWRQAQGQVFPVLMVLAVLLVVAPVPTLLVDLLLAANVTLAVVILLTTISVKRPLEFSVFPSVLLGTTLYRLVLNVASTRLILTRGGIDGTAAAGEVIEAFGQFVAGGQIVVGVILFAILIIIQFVVITKGATRISEVAARFALDGMPGKQMAIDADLNAGLITQEVARARRAEVAAQADFYGAMDGASKFVRGDAIAGIIITLINIVGGLYVGMAMHGKSFSEAATIYTTLTIGDGLVSQVPAFLISLASGLLVTRSSSESNLSNEVVGQMASHQEALYLAGIFVASLGVTGLPMLPMFCLGGACGLIGYSLQKQKRHDAAEAAVQEQRQLAEQQKPPEPNPEDQLQIDPLELELGMGLIPLVDPRSGGDLLDRIKLVRPLIAQELGIVLPKVRVRDNIQLGQFGYRVKLKDAAIATGEVRPDGLLAVDSGVTTGSIPGIPTQEPAFGRSARWIEAGMRERAELLQYNVVEPTAVLVTHLTELVRRNADQLLSRQQVHQLIEQLKQRSPKLVEEAIPDPIKPSLLHQVLRHLLRERVPIRDLETIVETLSVSVERTKDPLYLTEFCRHALSRAICQRYSDRDRSISAVVLDPALEDVLAQGFSQTENGLQVKLSPQVREAVADEIVKQSKMMATSGKTPLLLVGPHVRPFVQQIASAVVPNIVVLSMNEVSRDYVVKQAGVISASVLRATAPAMNSSNGLGNGTGRPSLNR